MMIEKMQEYFKNEYESTRDIPDKEARWYAVQRYLGVLQFVEMMNPEISFVPLDLMFEYYRERIMEG